jgi:hypothetical protein
MTAVMIGIDPHKSSIWPAASIARTDNAAGRMIGAEHSGTGALPDFPKVLGSQFGSQGLRARTYVLFRKRR